VRVVRRWYFTGKNEPRPGEGFEEVDVYVGDRLQKRGDLEKNALVLAHERIERNLFEAHVAPAFFFDGEQAQKLIENMGEAGIKKAVEVMFGTKVIGELSDTIAQYLVRARQNAGGKKKSSDRQIDLDEKIAQRDGLNLRIGKLQADHIKLEREKDDRDRERNGLQEELARLGGGGNADSARIQAEYLEAERKQADEEKALTAAVRSLGISLAMSRVAPLIVNRLKAEAALESWEGLKRGTVENKDKVIAVALPEPPESDVLLGNLSEEVRRKVRERFLDALERIYNPQPSDCAKEYLLGHVKGDARTKTLLHLSRVLAAGSTEAKGAARHLREAREALEDAKVKTERLNNLPQATKDIRIQLDSLNTQNQEISRKLGGLENEIKKLKSDLHTLNEEIGRIQEELARLGPEQKRIAVAERVSRALEELQERLKPTTTARLEDHVTKYFVAIADRRFGHGRIRLPVGGAPEIELEDGSRALLEMFSGFEKRSFGIAFSLALAEITRRRIPLIIDTPLGNADSEYRPRTLQALKDVDLDQIIILTHDKEVTPDLAESIKSATSQTFLVEFLGQARGSVVKPDSYFGC
jgi:DNA sulfur modification protein DndD